MNKLNPQHLFVPTQDTISGILARYNVPLTRFEPATNGIENLTLLVWSEQTTYVLRVYPQHKKSDGAILLELDLMSHLRKHGLPVPAIIASSDNQPFVVFEYGNQHWQCVLMEQAQGAHPQAYTPALLDTMATLQARMHTLGEAYAKTYTIPRGHSALGATAMAHDLLNDRAGDSAVRDFLQRATSFVVALDDSFPTGLSHLDYDIDNVLIKDDRVTAILDFGDMECLPVVVCLGYTLWDVLFEQGGSPEFVTRYVQTYQRVRQLNQREQGILPQIMLYRHYVILTVQMHFGHFSHTDLDTAIQQEQYLRNVKWQF